MILTGRTGLLALICVLPIAASPWPARTFVVLLTTLAIVVAVFRAKKTTNVDEVTLLKH